MPYGVQPSLYGPSGVLTGGSPQQTTSNDPFAEGFLGPDGTFYYRDPVTQQIVQIDPARTSSSGGSSAVQFPSQAALDEAQAAYYRAQIEDLANQFGLTQQQFYSGTSLANQQFGLDKWSTETNAYINALLAQLQAELGRGNLELDRDRFGLEGELGRGNLALDTERLGLDRELGLGRLGLDSRQLDEIIRGNKAQEAMAAKDFALNKASTALSAFMRSQELADARRLAAVQEQRALLGVAVDPNQQFFSGLGPNDPLANVAQGFGIGFSPSAISHQQINPAALALPPTQQQTGTDMGALMALLGG